MTEEVAVRMGLDTLKTSSLWVDQVVIEVNIAILHSFQVGVLRRNIDSFSTLVELRQDIGGIGTIVCPVTSRCRGLDFQEPTGFITAHGIFVSLLKTILREK